MQEWTFNYANTMVYVYGSTQEKAFSVSVRTLNPAPMTLLQKAQFPITPLVVV